MRKTRLPLLLLFAISSVAYATGKADGGKTKAKATLQQTEKKCTKGGDCCKKSSRAAMLKAKPAAKKA